MFMNINVNFEGNHPRLAKYRFYFQKNCSKKKKKKKEKRDMCSEKILHECHWTVVLVFATLILNNIIHNISDIIHPVSLASFHQV